MSESVSLGYVVVVRCGAPPQVDLYNVAEAERLLCVVAILENDAQPPPPAPAPETEKVKFLGPVNIRSGPGASFADLGNIATGDIAEILERARPGGWREDWGRLGKVYRAGKVLEDFTKDEAWAYLARAEPI